MSRNHEWILFFSWFCLILFVFFFSSYDRCEFKNKKKQTFLPVFKLMKTPTKWVWRVLRRHELQLYSSLCLALLVVTVETTRCYLACSMSFVREKGAARRVEAWVNLHLCKMQLCTHSHISNSPSFQTDDVVEMYIRGNTFRFQLELLPTLFHRTDVPIFYKF